MFARICLAAAVLTAASSAFAAGTLDVQADRPTRVYLDGEFVGETPLTLSDMQPGSYQIQAENPTSGELKTFVFHSPTRAHVRKTLDVSFVAAAPPQVVVAPPPPVKRVVYKPRPVACPTPVGYPSYNTARVWGRTGVATTRTSYPAVRTQREKAKVHTRNALLGATLASQTFTGNRRDRKRYRNVGLGLTLLNEILR